VAAAESDMNKCTSLFTTCGPATEVIRCEREISTKTDKECDLLQDRPVLLP